jgi:dipeptide/tripeptide permease
MFIAGATQNPWLVIFSIFILSLGEMAASPRFMEYVGTIAPPDRVALFLGYGFLPISFGTLIAGIMGGNLYGLLEAHRISVMTLWSIYGFIGIGTAVLLALFNSFFASKMVQHRAVE